MCMILGETAALWRGMHAVFHTIHDITRDDCIVGAFPDYICISGIIMTSFIAWKKKSIDNISIERFNKRGYLLQSPAAFFLNFDSIQPRLPCLQTPNSHPKSPSLVLAMLVQR